MKQERPPAPAGGGSEKLTDTEREGLQELLESNLDLPNMKKLVKAGLNRDNSIEQDNLEWSREFLVLWGRMENTPTVSSLERGLKLTDTEREGLQELLESNLDLPKIKNLIGMALDFKGPMRQKHLGWVREFLVLWKGE